METCKIVRGCLDCPFLEDGMDGLYCIHPYWEGRGHEKVIISANTPDNCPLKIEPFIRIIRLYKEGEVIIERKENNESLIDKYKAFYTKGAIRLQ